MTHLERHPEALKESAPPSLWGPVFWGELEEVAGKIPCSHCRSEAIRMLRGYHAAKNVELDKPPVQPADMLWLKRYLDQQISKCHRLGHCSGGSCPAKIERCVHRVKARGDDVNPYAVCKASVKCA